MINTETIELRVENDGIRIDSWLSNKLEKYSRTYLKKLIDDGSVTVNGKKVKSNYKLEDADLVVIDVPLPEMTSVLPEDIELDIIYEDQDIVVVNKPKGMVVHPAAGNYTGTMVNALLAHCKDSLSDINGIIRPGIVHRIDKDTSGILVVAKNNKAHEYLSEKLKEHDINRVYIAVVEGIIREEAGKINAPIGRHQTDRKKMAINIRSGRHAVTHFKVLERMKNATLIELKLETGRTHQIRVHMSYIGHPIIGDETYGSKRKIKDINGQALQAKLLGFVHPSTGEYIEFEIETPEYFKILLDELRAK